MAANSWKIRRRCIKKQNKTLFDSSDKKNTPKMLLIAVNIHNRKEIK
jgi:hypothetical protein